MKNTKNTTSAFTFIDDFNKELEKIEGVGTSSQPPRYWYSTGNYVLNRIISGNYTHGIPQGRITDLAGPSGSGKSYIGVNLAVAAQKAGAFCLIIDSEQSLDNDFVSKIGLDINNNYKYVSVTTISEVTKVVSSFLKGYKEQVGEDLDAPQVFILIDSLDMLMTDTELDHFEAGDSRGDHGQKNKQLKAILRTFVQAIKSLNVAIVCTSQVYKNQDIMNGEGLWIVSDAVKYAASQIVLIQKRKLKDASKGAKVSDVAGVRMICEGYKTRFTKPFQRVEIEVPYETGMDPYSGLKEVAIKVGVLEQRGNRLALSGQTTSWPEREMDQYIVTILSELEKKNISMLEVDAEVDETTETKADTKQRRATKVAKA